MTSRLLRLSRAAALITIVVMAWQVSLPLALPQFDTAHLPVPYLAPSIHLAEITALIAMTTYALAGWPNRAALRSGWRRVFALLLFGLILFEALSITWSVQRGLAAMQVLHVAVWAAFALLIACADCSPATMAFALLLGLTLHSVVGFIQISVRPVVEIVPQNSGISVVFSGMEHWQRIYGLSPHPNLLGGHLAVGVILTVGLIITHQRDNSRPRHCEERTESDTKWSRSERRSNPVSGDGRLLRRCAARNDARKNQLLLSVAWLILWATLLLTFSRSAWLAVLGGSIAAAALLIRGRHVTRSLSKPLVMLSGLGVIAVVIFVVWFQPFLVNRLAVTATPYETQAITDRLNSAQLALEIFAAHPLTGVGVSQSIVAAQSIAARDLLGTSIDWIHNVPLLIAAELGVGGSVLIGLMLIALGAIGLQRWRLRSIALWQALVGGALIALLVVMQFDHYVWTAAQGGVLWAWLVGWWLRADHMTAS